MITNTFIIGFCNWIKYTPPYTSATFLSPMSPIFFLPNPMPVLRMALYSLSLSHCVVISLIVLIVCGKLHIMGLSFWPSSLLPLIIITMLFFIFLNATEQWTLTLSFWLISRNIIFLYPSSIGTFRDFIYFKQLHSIHCVGVLTIL